MSIVITATTPATVNQVRSDALSSTSYLLAPGNPDRWQGKDFRELLGLEPRILPPPLPKSREAKAAVSFAKRWSNAHAQMHEAPADIALKEAQKASDTFFNRCARKPKAKSPHLPEDRHDPGTVFMRAIELAARALFDPAADGSFPDVDFIGQLGDGLIAFHDECADGHDPRFQPVRAMGRCLQSLTQILREAA